MKRLQQTNKNNKTIEYNLVDDKNNFLKNNQSIDIQNIEKEINNNNKNRNDNIFDNNIYNYGSSFSDVGKIVDQFFTGQFK